MNPISVAVVGKRFCLHLEDCGVELRFIEACAIRRSLASILNNEPYFTNAPEDKSVLIPGNTYVEEDGDDDIRFSVGPCFWTLNRVESGQLLEALDAALM